MEKTKGKALNIVLQKAAIRACRQVMKMMREEPHPIVIGDGIGNNSESTLKEISGWLFHRRQDDGSERNSTSN